MNNDGKLMYRLSFGIEDENIDTVKDLRIELLCSARWLTFGARLLRLHTSLCPARRDVSDHDKGIINRISHFKTEQDSWLTLRKCSQLDLPYLNS